MMCWPYDLFSIRFPMEKLRWLHLSVMPSAIISAFRCSPGRRSDIASIRPGVYRGWKSPKSFSSAFWPLWLGFFAVGGLVFLLDTVALPREIHLPFSSTRPLGVFFLVLVDSYLAASIAWKRPLKLRDWEFTLPPLPLCRDRPVRLPTWPYWATSCFYRRLSCSAWRAAVGYPWEIRWGHPARGRN